MVKVSLSADQSRATSVNPPIVSIEPHQAIPPAIHRKAPTLSMAAVPSSSAATVATAVSTMPATIVTATAAPAVVIVTPSVAVVAPTARPPPQHTQPPPSTAQHPHVLKGAPPQQLSMKMAPPPATTYVAANRTYSQPPPTLQHQPHPAHMHPIGPGCPAAGPPPQWPIVDPVFHFGPGFEHQHYCPTHSQGPQPHEHVVFFHVNIGVSVTFQIGGKRDIIRGTCYY